MRDEVIKTIDSKQDPFLYGSLVGADVALVQPAAAGGDPRPKAAASGTPTVTADPHAEARRDYELALQLGNRQAWAASLIQRS